MPFFRGLSLGMLFAYYQSFETKDVDTLQKKLLFAIRILAKKEVAHITKEFNLLEETNIS